MRSGRRKRRTTELPRTLTDHGPDSSRPTECGRLALRGVSLWMDETTAAVINAETASAPDTRRRHQSESTVGTPSAQIDRLARATSRHRQASTKKPLSPFAMPADLKPLPDLPSLAVPDASQVQVGLPVAPINRVRGFSSSEWEDFVLEWAHSHLKEEYADVRKEAGSGDMGRDVAGFVGDPDGTWDNYQCKHYKDPLQPNQIYVEVGKLFYYADQGEFSLPRHYSFVAPKDIGPSLSKLIDQPEKFREALITNWDKHCRGQITDSSQVPLSGPLRTLVKTADFSIFDAKRTLDLIEEHSKSPHHTARFGGGFQKPRPDPQQPPEIIAADESTYIRALLDAYGEHGKCVYDDPGKLVAGDEYYNHLGRSRTQFYSAEGLDRFSRDSLPPGAFAELQEEFFHGIADEIDEEHPDGYRRVRAVIRAAQELQVSAHALMSVLRTLDRQGICHQLANEGRVKWTK